MTQETKRPALGEQRVTAELTEELVRELRSPRFLGMTLSQISRKLQIEGIPVADVQAARDGLTWKHLN